MVTMYSVKKSRSGYIFDLPRERVAFMFLKDGTYMMFHDEEFLCYSMKPVEVPEEELERFEKRGRCPNWLEDSRPTSFRRSAQLRDSL
ncbi:hypothetical protein [Thermococcus sp.]|uniref:hypothetical protein n=1 Tax=Thermococcus sp. TaxID=35749 RepID=UPI0026145481|nr:hypothetical protein [Thermococcus sp.]